MEDEANGLLGSIRNIANISKYTRYIEDSSTLFTNWGTFATLFLVGGIIIVMSLPFASFILLNPKPFCMIFSLGSLVLLAATLQIIKLSSLFKQESIIASIIYFLSVAMSLYAGMFSIGYFRTIALILTQISSLLYLIVSQFPGGKKGITMVASQTSKQISKTIKGLLGRQQATFLPL